MGKRGLIPLAVMFLVLNVSIVLAAQSEQTTSNVFILNSGPTVVSVNVSTDPMEPGDIINILSNVTDNNGIPDDIDNVTAVLDMGTPSNSSDDVTIALWHNSTSDLYQNVTYQLSVAAPFGTYTANVTVFDTAGATSSASDTFIVTDATVPVINSISDTGPVDPGNTINFTANITDNVGVGTVLLEISGTNYTMTQLGSTDIWYYDTFDTNIVASTYTYIVYANDTIGNDATSSSDNFTVNVLISISLGQTPIEFGNTTIPITDRRADNGTAGSGYDGGTVKGFPLVVNNAGNVAENFSISGSALTGQTDGSYTVAVSGVEYDMDSNISGSSTLSGTMTEFATSISMSSSQDVYFWITIPSGLISQSYQGSVNITSVQS